MEPGPAELRVAIVGAGAMALEHARAFAAVPGVILAGIHSRTRARAEKLAAACGAKLVCDSVPELYEKTRAQLVVMAVSELAANAVSCACFRFPWTVLMEKPPGYDLADAHAIREEARRRGSKVLVALNRSFYSSTRTALEDLRQRPGPRHIHVLDQQDLAQAAGLGHPPLVLENWHYGNCIHLVDYFRLFGRGRLVALERVFPFDRRQPWLAAAKLTFDSGDTGLYEAVWNAPGPWAVMVTTAQRRWEMRLLERLARQDAGSRELVAVETHAWDRDFKPGFRLQAEHAVAAAVGRPSDSPTLDQALVTMSRIAAIYGDAETVQSTSAHA